MHDTLQGSSYALLWFHELSSAAPRMFHQLNPSLQFCHTLKEASAVEQDRGCATSRPASVFFRKLLTFEGIPVSAGATPPWSRPKRSSVPLSDKYRFQWTCIFCLALAFERIGGFSKCFDQLLPEDDRLNKKMQYQTAMHCHFVITLCRSHISTSAASSAKSVTASRSQSKIPASVTALMHAHYLQSAEKHDHQTIICHAVKVQCKELHDATAARQESEEVAELWRRMLTRRRPSWNIWHTYSIDLL